MNHIICDICGSEYSETAERCPICSYPRQGTEMAAAAAGKTVVERVKGGRFSEKNVKKRRKAQPAPAPERGGRNPNKTLLIVVALLLVANVLVAVYIAARFFQGRNAYQPQQTSATTTAPSETTLPPVIACKGIVMEASVLELEQVGDQIQLAVTLVPEDTTDVPVYSSDAPDVVSVSESGLLTAVGSGAATITVTCGEAVKECTVVCTAPTETTIPAEPGALTLDQTDVSLAAPGETVTLQALFGSAVLSGEQVAWTSSDPEVAAVENGLVTGAAKGSAIITAEYAGVQAICVVRCQILDSSWSASSTDVTLSVGEQFALTVKNSSGDTSDAIWIASQEGIVTVDGAAVTGQASGIVTLSTTVDGVALECIVRVK